MLTSSFLISVIFSLSNSEILLSNIEETLKNILTESEYVYGRIRGRFGTHPGIQGFNRQGRVSENFSNPRLWPRGRIPYAVENTIDSSEELILKRIFSNISSVTNIRFVPRTSQDSDYLLISEDIGKYGCGCCSIGVGYSEGSGAHVLVLAPVSEGGCGVNHIGGTHEILHILGFSHVQNRPDRCNYIDVDTRHLSGWGEWSVGQITESADWFSLRIPYDCSSYVHYYQLQGAVWNKDIMAKVDSFMENQGCESFQRGKFMNRCLVEGGFTENGRVIKDGYERCLEAWNAKHKKCVDYISNRYPTFQPVDPNGRCKKNGINKSERLSFQLSEWDIWAINAAYSGPLPTCQVSKRKGNGICDPGNNHIGCDYDGGDCCLPQAPNSECIDPCGVRWKFFNGTNRVCSTAPETSPFCKDHYWYGPNKCSDQYCRETPEKYLQWQCKNSCNLCNTNPSSVEMNAICSRFLPDHVTTKYKQKSADLPVQENIATRKNFIFVTEDIKVRALVTESFRSRDIVDNSTVSSNARISGNQSSSSRGSNSRSSNAPSSNNSGSSNDSRSSSRSSNASSNNFRSSNASNSNSGSSNSASNRSTGFSVIGSPERRLAMRSYWARTG